MPLYFVIYCLQPLQVYIYIKRANPRLQIDTRDLMYPKIPTDMHEGMDLHLSYAILHNRINVIIREC